MNFLFSYADEDSLSKHGYIITNQLAEILNSSVEYKITNTWGYGDFRNKTTMNGMFGQFLRNEVHLSCKHSIFFSSHPIPQIFKRKYQNCFQQLFSS